MLMRKFLIELNCRIISLHRERLLLAHHQPLALAIVVTEIKRMEYSLFTPGHKCSYRLIFVEGAGDDPILVFHSENIVSTRTFLR